LFFGTFQGIDTILKPERLPSDEKAWIYPFIQVFKIFFATDNLPHAQVAF